MCLPPPVLALAAAGVAAAGAGVGAMQAAASSRYQARIADRNAQLANEQARDAQDRGQIAAQRLYRQIGQQKGQQIAAMAANGLDLGSGSALQVQRDAAMIGAEDAAQLYRGVDAEVKGFGVNAANYRAQASGARQAATGAIVGGIFDVGTTVLGGAQQYAKLQPR